MEFEAGHLPGFYYLLLWKGYSEHLRTIIVESAPKEAGHLDYPDKPTAIWQQPHLQLTPFYRHLLASPPS